MPRPLETMEVTNLLSTAFVDYAAAVNYHRAFPDCRDGLKPVQRCLLLACHRMGLTGTGPKTMTKIQAVASEVSGKYHPHGDSAAADALYKLGQDWVMRYPMVLAEGNFGSPDEEPSAPRYPTTGLSQVGKFVIGDELNEEIIAHRPNYDGHHMIPTYMPSPFPNLLCNGQTGIGSAMAFTSISHNLGEVAAVIKTVAKYPNTTTDRILKLMPGPDLPTGGIIFRFAPNGNDAIRDYYETGKGTITIRGRLHRVGDTKSGNIKLIITEVPYGVGREALVKDISDRQDEFDEIVQVTNLSSDVTRIEIEIRRDADPDVVTKKLYDRTRLQTTFSINNSFVEVDTGNPTIRTMSIRDMVDAYIRHRLATILRRCQVRAEHISDRIHVLEGFLKALKAIRKVIGIVTNSDKDDSLLQELMDKVKLTERQADAILSMQLRSFTKMATDKVERELTKLRVELADLAIIINDENARIDEMCRELDNIVAKVGDDRRSVIVESSPNDAAADAAVADDRSLLIISDTNTIKRCATYEASHNTLTGSPTLRRDQAARTQAFLLVSPSDRVAIVDEMGQLYSFDASEVPFAPIDEHGELLSNICGITNRPVGLMVLPLSEPDKHCLLTISDLGFVKRTPVTAFVNRRPSGMRAVSPNGGENIIHTSITDGGASILLASSGNRVVRFAETDVNPQGVSARGVRGIRLDAGETISGCGVIPSGSTSVEVVAATALGRFRRCDVTAIRKTARDTRGFKLFSTIAADDHIVGVTVVRYGQVIKYQTVLRRPGIIDPSTIPQTAEADRGKETVNVKKSNPLSDIEGFDADVT